MAQATYSIGEIGWLWSISNAGDSCEPNFHGAKGKAGAALRDVVSVDRQVFSVDSCVVLR